MSLLKAGPASEEQVRRIDIPESCKPEPGSRFRPLTHAEALDYVQDAMHDCGLTMPDDGGKNFSLAADGAKMAGIMPIDLPIIGESFEGANDDARMQMLIMNSFDKTIALKLGFGSTISVCTNGSVFAEKVVGRKHTLNILEDLPVLIRQTLDATQSLVERQSDFFNKLREIELTTPQVHDIVVRLAKNNVVNKGQILDIVNEWQNPSYEAFNQPTAWALHNAVTENSKKIQYQNGVTFSSRMTMMTSMFNQEFGLAS